VARGATNLVGSNANSAAFLHWKASGRINYNAPSEKNTTLGEGSVQLTSTELSSRPGHTGASKTARDMRLGPTVYLVGFFRRKDSSVTSVTVLRRFSGAAVYRPRRIGDGGERNRIRPDCGTVSRGATNLVGPNAGSAAFLHGKVSGRINYNAPCERNTTHGERSDQLLRTEGNSRPRHTGPRRRPGICGWDPRSMRYATFV
jgi:hypothetical protein